MASVLIATADAIVAELNDPTDHTWTQTFEEAERNFGDWKLPLEIADENIRVDVFPVVPMPSESETRSSLEYRATVAIVVRKKFQPADSNADSGRVEHDAIDELVSFLEEINEHFAFLRMSEFEDAAWERSEIVPLVPEHLANPRQYTGLVRLTYRVPKAV